MWMCTQPSAYGARKGDVYTFLSIWRRKKILQGRKMQRYYLHSHIYSKRNVEVSYTHIPVPPCWHFFSFVDAHKRRAKKTTTDESKSISVQSRRCIKNGIMHACLFYAIQNNQKIHFSIHKMVFTTLSASTRVCVSVTYFQLQSPAFLLSKKKLYNVVSWTHKTFFYLRVQLLQEPKKMMPLLSFLWR